VPKKLTAAETWSTLVQERLGVWGRTIRVQRLRQRITGADLCARLGISRATLHRLEQGDPGASAGAYFSALLTLGIADFATPALPVEVWRDEPGQRVKLTKQERQGDDAEYF
jgi:transcriptional regulator with XRE-family HTH domain